MMSEAKESKKEARDVATSSKRQTLQDSVGDARQPNHLPGSPHFLQRCLGNSYLRAVAGERQTREAEDLPDNAIQAGAGQTIQTKLVVSKPGDEYEQEADRVMEAVMRISEPRVKRQLEPEEKEGIFQTKTTGTASELTYDLESHIQTIRGGGQLLSPSIRAFFEPRFGFDFSQVRVHTDQHAAKVAKSLSARAFTIGQDVMFNAGQYAPETSKGKQLLAHELTHVVQQADIGYTTSQAPDVSSVQLKNGEEEEGKTKHPLSLYTFELKLLNVYEEIAKVVEEVEEVEVAPKALPEMAKALLKTLLVLAREYGIIALAAWRSIEVSLVWQKESMRERLITDPVEYLAACRFWAEEAAEKHFTLAFMYLKDMYDTDNESMKKHFFEIARYHFGRSYYVVDLLDGLKSIGFPEGDPLTELIKRDIERTEEFFKLLHIAYLEAEERKSLRSKFRSRGYHR